MFSPDSHSLLCCCLSTGSPTNHIASWNVRMGSVIGVKESAVEAKGRPSAKCPPPHLHRCGRSSHLVYSPCFGYILHSCME